VISTVCELLHPFLPFVTEEIWQRFNPGKGSIMVAQYPVADSRLFDPNAEATMEMIIEVITAIRNIRAEMGIPPGEKIEALLFCDNELRLRSVLDHEEYVQNLARVKKVIAKREGERPKFAAAALVGDIEIFIPLEGVIDIEAEEARLKKDLVKVEKDLATIEKKLTNPEFLAKAPAEVVEKVKGEGTELQEKHDKLIARIEKMEKIQ